MPTAGIDRIVRYLQYIFIDGKFYTIFSLLFGIGFSIIITNAARKGANGFRIFYRRMFVFDLIDSAPDVSLERRYTDVVRLARYAAAIVPQSSQPGVAGVGIRFDGDTCSCGFCRGIVRYIPVGISGGTSTILL